MPPMFGVHIPDFSTLRVARRIRRAVSVCILAAGVVLGYEAAAAEAVAAKYPEIEYASPDQSVWTTRLNAQGEPDNPLLQVAEALFSQAGIAWHGKAYPASRLFLYLQNGSAQFSMLVKAPALQECCLFSRKPIAVAEIRAYHRAGTAPVRSVQDLAGKRLITIRGYSYGGLINFLNDETQRVTNNVTASHVSAFRMLDSGRAEYVIDYAGPASEVLAAERIEGVSYEVLSRQDVHLVLSKTYPDAPAVMQRLEAIAETLDVEGMLNPAALRDRKGAFTKPRNSR